MRFEVKSHKEQPNTKIAQIQNRQGENAEQKEVQNQIFSLKNQIFSLKTTQELIITEITLLPPSFDWNLEIVKTHFYSIKYEIKLGSDKEPPPL
jgi:hypothetical protein